MKVYFFDFKKSMVIGLTTLMIIFTAGFNMFETKAVINENPLSDSKIFTKMDEDGNITEMTKEEKSASGIVKTASSKGRSAISSINTEEGVVNFRTKGSATTEYTDVATGRQGYTCGTYGADAAYLGHSSDGKVIFMLSGVIGKVAANEVQLLNYSDASVNTFSKYYVKDGTLYHGIVTNLNDKGYSSNINVGPKPSYLEEGKSYFSYDGHYFYTDTGNKNGYIKMLTDYRNDTRANSLNSNSPYYNYYQYLSLRSITTLTANHFNNRISSVKGSESIIYNKGESFVYAQNTYGINAALMFGLACNESTYGTSVIAKDKNNLFGINAVDSDPYESANYFSSIEQCINEYAYNLMSKQYLSGENYKYHGAHYGDKNSGANIKYASDPYWGEKAAAQSYILDPSGTDYGRYSIGIATSGVISAYKESSTSSKKIYTTSDSSNRAINDYSVTILGTVTGSDGNKWYKVLSDMPLKSDRSARDISAKYNQDRDYVYINAKDVKVVYNSGHTTKPTLPPTPDLPEIPTPTPPVTYKIGDVNLDQKIDSMDMYQITQHILGKIKLQGLNFDAANTDGNDKIDSMDMYNLIQIILKN